MSEKSVWTFWTFHTAACRAHLVDPGATCICRTPEALAARAYAVEPCACGSSCAPREGCRSEPTYDVPFRTGRAA